MYVRPSVYGADCTEGRGPGLRPLVVGPMSYGPTPRLSRGGGDLRGRRVGRGDTPGKGSKRR